MARNNYRAFTLLELLVVVGIIAVLAGIILPSMGKAREKGRTLVCLSHLRELGAGWQTYADENEDVLLPGRMFKAPGGKDNPDNWYHVGNGLKYRPRWAAMLGAQVDVFAFQKPKRNEDRQDYDNDVYQCPVVPKWVDERNYAYGYNYQFLGNARQTNKVFHNFPVKRHRITAAGRTVVAADAMGTAAGFMASERQGYLNDGIALESKGNHGWSLDPPRLTDESDVGTGDETTTRTAVDPRHRGKVNVYFADGHGAMMTDRELGYRKTKRGRYVYLDPDEGDEGGGGGGVSSAFTPEPGQAVAAGLEISAFQTEFQGVADPAGNHFFSGTGRDDDPPAVPKAAGQ